MIKSISKNAIGSSRIKEKLLTLVLLLPIFLVLSINLVHSQGSIDNLKTYTKTASQSYGSVTIYTTAAKSTSLYKITLSKNTEICSGLCYAEGNITLYTSEKLVDYIAFKDLKINRETSVNYKILIQSGTKTITVDDVVLTDNVLPNGSIEKVEKKITKDIEIPNWITYNGNILPAGNYAWRIEGTLKNGDKVDWLGVWAGVRVDNWASWTNAVVVESFLTYSGNACNVQGCGQNFTVGTTGINRNYTLVGVSFMYDDEGTKTVTSCNYTLWTSGFAQALSSNMTDCSEMATKNAFFNVSMPEAKLVAGTNYIITILGQAGGSMYISRNNPGGYAGGQGFYNLGAGFLTETTDLDFYIYGQNYTEIPITPFNITLLTPANKSVLTNPNSINFTWLVNSFYDYNETLWIWKNGTLHYKTNTTYCFQESANTSSLDSGVPNCNRNYSGTYKFSGSWANPSSTDRLYDGNYVSDDYPNNGNTADFIINYTKPIGQNMTTAVWKYKTSDGINYTKIIPPSCFYYNPNKIILNVTIYRAFNDGVKFVSGANFSCYNGNWNRIGYLDGATNLYEEAIIWNNYNITEETTYSWNVNANNTNAQTAWGLNGNYTFTLDVTNPIINYAYVNDTNAGNFLFGYNRRGITLNWSITVPNPDKIWYNYNGTNVTLYGLINGTTFNLTYKTLNQNLTLWVNDTGGHISSMQVNWSYLTFLNSNGYNNTVYETEGQSYYLNISLDRSLYYIGDDSYLEWFGAPSPLFPVTIKYGTSVALLNTTVQIPIQKNFIAAISDGSTLTANWRLSIYYLNGSLKTALSTNNFGFTYFNISIGQCLGGDNMDWNFTNITFYDSNTLQQLNDVQIGATVAYTAGNGNATKFLANTFGGYKTFNLNNGSINESLICSKEILTGDTTYGNYQFSGIITLKKLGYKQQNYVLFGPLFNIASEVDSGILDGVQYVPLKIYLINSSNTEIFTIQLVNSNQLAVPNYFIKVRQCQASNFSNCTTIQSSITNTNGQVPAYLVPDTTFYQFLVYNNFGDLVYSSDVRTVQLGTAPYTITITLDDNLQYPLNYLNNVSGFTYSLTYNKSNNIVTYYYFDSNISFASSRLLVTENNASGSNAIVCDTTSTTNPNTIYCNVSSFGDGSYTAAIYLTRDQTYFITSIPFEIESFADSIGLMGLFGGFILILICASLFLFNEIAGIIAINVGIIFINLIGIVHFGGVVITAIIGISVLLIIILDRS